jgi:hypothetical protein
VTSPASAASSPSRRAPTSPLRRAAKIVLIIGTAISLGSAFGPTWVTKIGIAIAIVAAAAGCSLAWRELRQTRRAHARQVLQLSKDHGKALSEERRHNAAVLDTMSQRVRDYVVVMEGQKITIAQLRSQVSALRGDNAYLKTEILHREKVITSLRETVRAREAELIAMLAEESVEPAKRPRRSLAELEPSTAEVPADGDLWTDDSHPTVADLPALEAALQVPELETARKLA